MDTAIDLQVVRVLGEALALGLLIGSERYRGREPGEHKSAGVRTFAIFALLGAIAGLVANPLLTAITLAAIAALMLAGYLRSSATSLGTTTELAALLVFWIGYLLTLHEVAAVALGVVLTIILAAKEALHGFVRDRVSEAEFEATLKFLAVVLVIYPILPDRPVGPLATINPREAWGLVILVSTLSFAGYVLIRWLGQRRGLLAGAVLGGLVSTTAVTMALAARAREQPAASRLLAVAAVLANSVQGPRLLVLVWVVSATLARELLVPLAGMGLAGIVGAALLARGAAEEDRVLFSLRNPYSLGPALRFALFIVTALLLLRLVNERFGDAGTLMASALGGGASVSAVALSVSKMVGGGELDTDVARRSVVVALAANAVVKLTIATLYGTRRLALWLGAGLAALLATAIALVALA